MEETLERIDRGLFGDEKTDQWGLFLRVKNHGIRISRLEKIAALVAAVGVVVGILYKVVTDWAPKLGVLLFS